MQKKSRLERKIDFSGRKSWSILVVLYKYIKITVLVIKLEMVGRDVSGLQAVGRDALCARLGGR